MALNKNKRVAIFGVNGTLVGITHILWTPAMGEDVQVHFGFFSDRQSFIDGAEPLEQGKVVVPGIINANNIRREAYLYLKTLPDFADATDEIIT